MNSSSEAVRRIVEQEGEVDDILRAVVASVASSPEISWAGIAFAEDDTLRLGPVDGEPNAERRERVPIAYEGAVVGELWADGAVQRDELERIAALIGPYVLLGWDTGGEKWDP